MTEKKTTKKRAFIPQETQAYIEKTKLQEQELKNIKVKLRLKMELLEFERETNRLFHEWALERGRIKRAEDRKAFAEKRAYRDYNYKGG